MYNLFCNYIAKHNLFDDNHKILVAVSGGVDSIVLLDLLHKYSKNIAVAHCNFQLRGEESEADYIFVKGLSEQYNIPFHFIRFDTTEYCKINKISIQMGARDLRYNWFEQIKQENNYDYIAVAHHLDDVNETFFVNLARGTGIAGLRGIKNKLGNIVRPLLFASKSELQKYAVENKLLNREDSSNSSLKYKRNIIRHSIIPIFRNLNPSFDKTLLQTIELLEQYENFFNKYYETLKLDLVYTNSDGLLVINYDKLLENEFSDIIAYKLLDEYGFTASQIRDIISTELSTGAIIESESHILLQNRGECIIKSKDNDTKSPNNKHFIDIKNAKIEYPLKLIFKEMCMQDLSTLKQAPNIALLDFDTLSLPLYLRKWEIGDSFYPIGLGGKKKISSYFKDIKLSRFEKENVWLLCSGDCIIWVVGYRLDNRFKITQNTKRILFLEKIE